LAAELRRGASDAGVPVQVNQIGSLFTVFFSTQPVRHYGDVMQANPRRFAAWARTLRDRGVLVPPSPYEAAFLSTAHAEAEMRRAARAWRDGWAHASSGLFA
jgi:glutamate-1-semialdehyde 2,1-aminomutase